MLSGNCYRTNSVDITSILTSSSSSLSSPSSSSSSNLGRVFSINWNQESIFDSHSGVLRAVYAHIEVWCIVKTSNGVTSSESLYIPLGEVYLPLKQLTEKYIESKLPLLWTPKMPLEYKDEYESFGFIIIGAKVIRGGEDFPTIAQLTLNSSISLTPATSSRWIGRPIYDSTIDQLNDLNDCYFINCCASSFQVTSYESEIENISWKKYVSKSTQLNTLQKSDTNNQSSGIMKTLSVNIGRRLSSSTSSSSSTILHHPSLQIVNSQNFGSIEGSTLNQVNQLQKSKLHSSNILRTSIESQQSSSNQLLIQIPWNQILNVTLTSESSLIVKFEVHTQPTKNEEEKLNQLETVEFEILIGPCPAKR